MKKIFVISTVMLICSFSKAQTFIPFPDKFSGSNFYTEEEGIGVWGYYFQSGRRYSSYIENDLSTVNDSTEIKKSWRSSAFDESLSTNDSLLILYYNQLFKLKIDFSNEIAYLFDASLNYIAVWGREGNDLDSISQASGINDISICKDTLLYASVKNNGKNFIVRKKGIAGGWETLPIVISKPGSINNLRNVFLWIVILLSALAFFLYIRFKGKGKEIDAEISKDNDVYNQLKLAADKPLDYEQITNKDTKDAIDAIVEVIQNRNTPLPMTVAINGAWGSGKSTIMNCIRQKLDIDKEKRFITTWFNAWHQQTESSLLNAFLLKIINRYEKPFFKNNSWKAGLAFMRFRFQLASSRFIKWSFYNQILSGFALSFLFLIILIIIINLYGYADSSFFKQVGLHNINLKNLFSDGNMKSIQTIGTVMALVLSVCSFFILRSESTPTIGAFLNVMYKKSFLVDVEKNNPDLREKFRTQYWEIMDAVEDRVLIVFIDDLDRVSGDKIFEMLEAVNFIGDVTSRPDDSNKHSLKTVFVLGLYIDQVAEQLGIYIQKENPYRDKENAGNAKKEAKDLGKRYIEKMIQLNVPVPLTNKGI